MRYSAALLALSLLLPAPALAHMLTNGRVVVGLAIGEGGLNGTTMDRVDSLTWIDSDGATTGSYVSNSGAGPCNDPQEFFGQSYGDVDGTTLLMVVAGTSAKWKQGDTFLQGTSKTKGTDECAALSGKTTTVYSLTAAKALVNTLKIVRTFRFSAAAKDQNYNLRAYAPRLPNSKYKTILYPDAAGAIQTLNLFNCPVAGSCTISDWNGKWFADDDGAGGGMMVIRDKSSTAPARLAGDYDSFSASNVTSILLTRPETGWKGKLVETEYLCFYDAKSWPAAKREAGALPKGCTVK